MYGAFDLNGKLVAYHERKRVVLQYMDNNQMSTNQTLRIHKIRKGQEQVLYGKEDLYLVVYGKTYIQSGYIQYLELVGDDQLCQDTQYAIDVLCRVLEIHKLSKKSEKRIQKAIKELENVLAEDEYYTPSLTDLNNMKDYFDPYISGRRFYECD